MEKKKKNLGITIARIFFILIFIFFILLFGAGIVVFSITFLENRMDFMPTLLFTVFHLAVMGLSLWGLIHQIKKIKTAEMTEIVEYTEELNIHFDSQISYKDYRNLILELSFKIWHYVILLVFFVFYSLLFFISDVDINVKNIISLVVIMVIGILFLRLKHAKNTYQTNKMFHEQLSYTLDNEAVHAKGKTIESTVLWTWYYKIKETKNFFLLYHDKTLATFLPKKAFKTGDIELFRKFVKSLNLKVEIFEEKNSKKS